MSLYPSLEDMKVDQLSRAQVTAATVQAQQHAASRPQGAPPAYGAAPALGAPPAYGVAPGSGNNMAVSALYPSLNEYMGLSITPEMLDQATAIAVAHQPSPQDRQLAVKQSHQQMVAPVSANNVVGVMRAEIKQGVREVTLCKDEGGKIGLRVRHVNKGVFVAFVYKNSPASMAGLRFGDQILQINGESVAGWDTDKCMKVLKKAAPERITMAIRDRPFERTITLQKDSTGHVGFVFKDNKITAIVKDSSAARNGVLIEHHLVEVNGQNVVGLKEKAIKEIFDASPRTVTITVIPTVIYDHIIKSMGSSLFKNMDHSIPDL